MRIQARPARPSARSGVRSILRPGLVGALAALGTVGAQAAPACPARDFPGFLAAFADDVAVQKAFVAVPLRSDTIDPEAEPEPKPVTTMLGADALRLLEVRWARGGRQRLPAASPYASPPLARAA